MYAHRFTSQQLSGYLPFLFLPVKVLKEILQQGSGTANFRKPLVVSQFFISIMLFIGTVIIFQQINHVKSRSIGYNPDNLITLDASEDLVKNYNAVKYDLLNTGYIASVAKASSAMKRWLVWKRGKIKVGKMVAYCRLSKNLLRSTRAIPTAQPMIN